MKPLSKPTTPWLIFSAIIIVGLIIASAIYFSRSQNNKNTGEIIGNTNTNAGDCSDISTLPDNATKLATKVIDGDTFIIEGGQSVRIIGIDSDEKGYPCFDIAKNRLEEMILNKSVKLEKGTDDLDQYCRYLRYVFLDNENIGLQMVSLGLAVARFYPENVKYRSEIELAEQTAKNGKIGCKWSGVGVAEVDNSDRNDLQWEKLTAGKIVGACQAGNYYGQEITVEGKIVDAYHSKTNTIFLNLDKPYPSHCFTAVIFSGDQYKFVGNPENYYANQTVRIKGKIKEYQGKPEIILENPEQIEIGK